MSDPSKSTGQPASDIELLRIQEEMTLDERGRIANHWGITIAATHDAQLLFLGSELEAQLANELQKSFDAAPHQEDFTLPPASLAACERLLHDAGASFRRTCGPYYPVPTGRASCQPPRSRSGRAERSTRSGREPRQLGHGRVGPTPRRPARSLGDRDDRPPCRVDLSHTEGHDRPRRRMRRMDRSRVSWARPRGGSHRGVGDHARTDRPPSLLQHRRHEPLLSTSRGPTQPALDRLDLGRHQTTRRNSISTAPPQHPVTRKRTRMFRSGAPCARRLTTRSVHPHVVCSTSTVGA